MLKEITVKDYMASNLVTFPPDMNILDASTNWSAIKFPARAWWTGMAIWRASFPNGTA